jgi:hypothetical protein
MLPLPGKKMCGWSEARQLGAPWMVVRKLSRPEYVRETILVSDRLFASDQNERSFAGEKHFHKFRPVEVRMFSTRANSGESDAGNEK